MDEVVSSGTIVPFVCPIVEQGFDILNLWSWSNEPVNRSYLPDMPTSSAKSA